MTRNICSDVNWGNFFKKCLAVGWKNFWTDWGVLHYEAGGRLIKYCESIYLCDHPGLKLYIKYNFIFAWSNSFCFLLKGNSLRLCLHDLFLVNTGLLWKSSELTGNFVHGLAQDWTQPNKTCLWFPHIQLGFLQCWSIIRAFFSHWFMSGQEDHGQTKTAKHLKLWPSWSQGFLHVVSMNVLCIQNLSFS